VKKKEIDYIWTDKKRTLFGLPLSFTRYFMTKEKFIRRRGFFNLIEDEFELYKVTDKKLKLPFGQRIFFCGTIIINVKDVDTPILEVVSIKKVRTVLQILEDSVNAQRDRYNIRGRDMVGAGSDNEEN